MDGRSNGMTPSAVRQWSAVDRAVIAALRLIPPGTAGKARLARLLLHDTQQSIEVTAGSGHVLSMPSLREPVAFHSVIDGVYEPEMVALLRRLLRIGDTFMDVGANVGVFSLLASDLVGPGGTVIAVEASPDVARHLVINVERNRSTNVKLVGKAVAADGPASAQFWPAPPGHFGMGALAPQFDVEPITVPADTIDHIVSEAGVGAIDVLKIDIEGFESAAFGGAQATLAGAQAPSVLFEFVDWAETRAGFECGAAQRQMQALGYVLYRIGPKGTLSKLDQPIETGSANILAMPGGRDHRLAGLLQ